MTVAETAATITAAAAPPPPDVVNGEKKEKMLQRTVMVLNALVYTMILPCTAVTVKSRKSLHRLVPFQTALFPSNIPYSNCHEYGTLRTSDIADCHKLQSIDHTSILKMSGLSMYFESTF